jgi:hypothetical protein
MNEGIRQLIEKWLDNSKGGYPPDSKTTFRICARELAALLHAGEVPQPAKLPQNDYAKRLLIEEKGFAMNDIPRRAQMQQWVAAERAIYDAMRAVEAMPADVRLTKGVTLLGDAMSAVADYVDGKSDEPVQPHPMFDICQCGHHRVNHAGVGACILCQKCYVFAGALPPVQTERTTT